MFKCYLQRCEFNFLFEVFCHKVPPHDCAAGVRTKNRHKKKNAFHILLALLVEERTPVK